MARSPQNNLAWWFSGILVAAMAWTRGGGSSSPPRNTPLPLSVVTAVIMSRPRLVVIPLAYTPCVYMCM